MRCEGLVSSSFPTHVWVPLGSILGIFFFQIYINDIGQAIKNCKLHLFADDTVLYVTGETIN